MKYELRQYRIAAGLVAKRLGWDLSLFGIMQRRRILRWANSHAGEKALIFCNGPSLNHVDFSMVHESGIFIFGLNKINLLFERTTLRPNVIVAVNPLVIQQNAEFYSHTEIPLFMDIKGRTSVPNRSTVHFLLTTGPAGTFSTNVVKGVNQGNTVTFVAFQLAYYMGFKFVGIVGADHNFATKGPPNAIVVSADNDENHFDSKYFAGGALWQLPDLIASEYHYQIADFIYRRDGRKVYNCTVGGQLDLFERKTLEAFLNM